MITSIIDPDDGGGTDYLSLSLWEAGLAATLTDDVEATCRSSSGSADVTSFVFGVTSLSTYFAEIKPIAGNEASTSYSASKYRHEAPASGTFYIFMGLTVNNIQLGPTDNDGIRILNTEDGDVIVKKCLLKGHSVNYENAIWVSANAAGNDVYIFNNIVYKMSGSENTGIFSAAGGTTYVENNTFAGCTRGIRQGGGTLTAINNIVDGSGDTSAYLGTFTASNYNCTDGTDTDDGGAQSIQSGTIVFENTGAGTEDYATKVGSTDTIEEGTDTVNGGYTDDIDGTARGAAWDIGAFEYVSAVEDLSVDEFETVGLTEDITTILSDLKIDKSDLINLVEDITTILSDLVIDENEAVSVLEDVIAEVIGIVLEQEGFRWRDDDDSEAAATWLAEQDIDINRARGISTRVRFLINASEDPDAKQFKIQYKKTTDAVWRDMPTS